MERLEKDLRYFQLQLANEKDSFRRILLLDQIRNVKEQIHYLCRQEVEQLERENKNLSDAIEGAMKKKKK